MRSITFCTTCKGRLWQLEQTLPHNLAKLEENCDLVLLDYQSPDGLRDYIFNNFQAELSSGKLKYFRLEHDYNYTSSYAKNVAHKLATGEVLFNLDGDNQIHEGLIAELRDLKHHQFFLPRLHGNDEGSYGRLGYTRRTFHMLGGYDETIVGMKGDDGALRVTARQHRLRPVHAKQIVVAIQNTREQKDLYVNMPGKSNPPIYPDRYGVADVTDHLGNMFSI